MSEFKFNVETKEAGQRRPYGDSYYHFIVESELGVDTIESFCKHVLRGSLISEDEYLKNIRAKGCDFGEHFKSYYTAFEVLNQVPFLEDGLNKVEIKITQPSTH